VYRGQCGIYGSCLLGLVTPWKNFFKAEQKAAVNNPSSSLAVHCNLLVFRLVAFPQSGNIGMAFKGLWENFESCGFVSSRSTARYS